MAATAPTRWTARPPPGWMLSWRCCTANRRRWYEQNDLLSCKYAPLELFAGYGATFSALDPLAESFSCAERCAHANLCGYAKAVLEQVERSGIRALVLTNCCDAMLRVYDVLAASGKMEFLQLLPSPHQTPGHPRPLCAGPAQAGGCPAAVHRAGIRRPARPHLLHKPHAEGPHLTLLGAHGGSVLYDTVQKAFALPVVDATCTGNRELADVAPAALEDFLPVTPPPCWARYPACGWMPRSVSAPPWWTARPLALCTTPCSSVIITPRPDRAGAVPSAGIKN